MTATTQEHTTAMILVTGVHNSGTMYMARLFACFGYDIGHEVMGRDGTSCGAWAVDDPLLGNDTQPGPRPDLSGWTVFHVVRDPLKTVAALAQGRWGKISPRRRDFIGRRVGGPNTAPPLRRAAHYYVAMTTAADELAQHRIKVEESPDQLREILKRDPVLPLPPTNTNTKEHNGLRVPTTYHAISLAAGDEIAAAVHDLSVRFGYA